MDDVTVGWSKADRVIVWGGFPLLGAVLGWFLPQAVYLLRSLPVGPFDWLADLLDRAPAGLVTPAAVGFGATVGAVLAGIGEYEALRVRLTRHELTLRHKDVTVHIPRAEVVHVFVDAKRLVVLGPDGRQRAGEPTDTAADRLQAAFEEMGYPWRDGDPHAAEFRRWVPGLPGVPETAGALLVARQQALQRRDDAEAELLRTELNLVGVLVRDEKSRQHWRLAH